MPPLQQRYFDILLERVRGDRFPSHQLLDRLERTLFSSEQIVAYVAVLLEKIDESWYPSLEMLDRIQRMVSLTAKGAR